MTRCVVVGSGAREHALAWALSQRAEVIVTPGNAGMAAHGLECVSDEPTTLVADLFVIGPEQPLVEGLADQLRAQGKAVVGPGSLGAQLEGSKAFMKEFLRGAGVPSAGYGAFGEESAALAYLATMRAPYVVKTDGLAAGKGVLVTEDFEAARSDVRDKLSGVAFGAAGATVVIEEALYGEECSLHVLCDGTNVVALVPAQDFKRVGDGDVGANTGGMGAYAPMTTMTPSLLEEILRRVIVPTVSELQRRDIDFRGVLYAGLMLTAAGPQLLEYNVRFGDPECEVLATLYGGELVELLLRTARGRLEGAEAPTSGAAVTVVLAAEGYPQSPRVGDVIEGLGADGQLTTPLEGVVVFHAGTVRDEEGRFRTSGGRVLAVTARGENLDEARRRAYQGASLVTFRGRVVREDVARVAARGEE